MKTKTNDDKLLSLIQSERQLLILPSGKTVTIDDLKPSDFTSEELVTGMSRIYRFGTLQNQWTVLHHSFAITHFLRADILKKNSKDGQQLMKQAIFHDAAEVFVTDLPSSIKTLVPEFKVVEKKVEAVIFKKLKLAPITNPIIKHIDLHIGFVERALFVYRNLNKRAFNRDYKLIKQSPICSRLLQIIESY